MFTIWVKKMVFIYLMDVKVSMSWLIVNSAAMNTGVHVFLKKVWYVYIHTMDNYSAIKQKNANILCSNMDELRDNHTKSETERKTNVM